MQREASPRVAYVQVNVQTRRLERELGCLRKMDFCMEMTLAEFPDRVAKPPVETTKIQWLSGQPLKLSGTKI